MSNTDKNMALVRAGIKPQEWGMRKGVRVHKNTRRNERMGKVKHKIRY